MKKQINDASIRNPFNKLLKIVNKKDVGPEDLGVIIESQKDINERILSILSGDIDNKLLDILEFLKTTWIPEMVSQIIEEKKKEFPLVEVWGNIKESISNFFENIITKQSFWWDKIIGPLDFGTGNEESEKLLNDTLRQEFEKEIKRNRSLFVKSAVNAVAKDTFQIINHWIDVLEEKKIIDEKLKEELKKKITEKYLDGVHSEINQKIEDFYNKLDEAKKDKNIFVKIEDNKKIQQDIQKIVDTVEGGSQNEQTIKKISENFEAMYIQKLHNLCVVILEDSIIEKISTSESIEALEKYETTDPEYIEWKKKVDILPKKQDIINRYNDVKKGIVSDLLLNIPRIIRKGNLVSFDGEMVAVNEAGLRGPKTQSWDVYPDLEKDDVVLTLKNRRSREQIIPDDKKKLRMNSPYMIDRAKWGELQKTYNNLIKSEEFKTMYNQRENLIKEIEKQALFGNTDQERKLRKELGKVNADILKKMPHDIFAIKDRFNHAKETSYGEVPALYENIVISPYVMKNLKGLIRLLRSQLLKQDGISTLEGDAGVGKNVLIDIYAHYTNRKVFTFPCNKRASKEDLTYQWLINENGTYKLHSKVYEAARTKGSILVFDEINTLPEEVIKLLNGLFDYRRRLTMPYDNEYVKAEQDLLIIGTQNPTNYLGTTEKPQDIRSRERTYLVEYPPLFDPSNPEIATYDEALITYRNTPYYYKLLEMKGYDQAKVKKTLLLIERKMNRQKLSPEEEKEIALMKGAILTNQEFIELWNEVVNKNNTQEMKDKYGEETIEGIKDIYTLLKYTQNIRNRYMEKMKGKQKMDKISTSVSQRDINKMMDELQEGKSAKEAFINVYCSSIAQTDVRESITNDIKSINL